jgi:hypothetical protein
MAATRMLVRPKARAKSTIVAQIGKPIDKAPARLRNQSQFAAIVSERIGEHSGLFKKIAVETESSHHIPGVVRQLGNVLSTSIGNGQSLHGRFQTLALSSVPP